MKRSDLQSLAKRRGFHVDGDECVPGWIIDEINRAGRKARREERKRLVAWLRSCGPGMRATEAALILSAKP